jgi:hypothetical protein
MIDKIANTTLVGSGKNFADPTANVGKVLVGVTFQLQATNEFTLPATRSKRNASSGCSTTPVSQKSCVDRANGIITAPISSGPLVSQEVR